MLITPALGKYRQEGHKFQVSLGYIMRLSQKKKKIRPLDLQVTSYMPPKQCCMNWNQQLTGEGNNKFKRACSFRCI